MLKQGAQLLVVVDLAVVNQDELAVTRLVGLCLRPLSDDRQSRVPQRDLACLQGCRSQLLQFPRSGYRAV